MQIISIVVRETAYTALAQDRMLAVGAVNFRNGLETGTPELDRFSGHIDFGKDSSFSTNPHLANSPVYAGIRGCSEYPVIALKNENALYAAFSRWLMQASQDARVNIVINRGLLYPRALQFLHQYLEYVRQQHLPGAPNLHVEELGCLLLMAGINPEINQLKMASAYLPHGERQFLFNPLWEAAVTGACAVQAMWKSNDEDGRKVRFLRP